MLGENRSASVRQLWSNVLLGSVKEVVGHVERLKVNSGCKVSE